MLCNIEDPENDIVELSNHIQIQTTLLQQNVEGHWFFYLEAFEHHFK